MANVTYSELTDSQNRNGICKKTIPAPENCLPQITQALGSNDAGEPKPSEFLAKDLVSVLSKCSTLYTNGIY